MERAGGAGWIDIGGTAIRSSVAGITWPAIPSARSAQILAMLYQLEQTQWWPAERLLEHQLRQLRRLLRHAAATVPFYRERFATAGWDPLQPLTLNTFRRLPLLTRREIQRAGPALHSTALPAVFGKPGETRTSGSTGEPLTVRRTPVDQLLWQANLLRDHHWHQRNFAGKVAVIRSMGDAAPPPHGSMSPNWGAPSAEIYRTGPTVRLSTAADVATQARWLLKHNPEYLLTYPSLVRPLMGWFVEYGERPQRLCEIRTVGETVDPSLREFCSEAGIAVVDGYSSEEMGYLALQCPVSGHFHVMAESVLLEVIDETGKPCAPGETGQVVVTTLHNAAMPLLRYKLGDHAVAGGACECGRGLPTIERVLGRVRNLLTLPSGQRVRLSFHRQFRDFPMVRQYQLIQHTSNDIETRLLADAPFTAEMENHLRGALQRVMGHPFHISFVYFTGALPRGPGGKFDDFISLLQQHDSTQ